MTPRAYVIWVVGGCLVVLASMVTPNLLLIANDHRFDKNTLASQWQQESGGVTYAPPITLNRAFKVLRVHDQLAEVNLLVFGSSTAMGITADAFTADVRAYNFAQSGNSLLSVIGEAQYVVGHWEKQVRFLVIPLDWSLGFIYLPGAPPPTDLSAASISTAAPPPVVERLRDALSLPRLKNLATVLRDIFTASEPLAVARQLFTQPAGTPYRCPDGVMARDYDIIYRGLCVGFRNDGSATFADQKRVTAGTWQSVVAQAASASSQYAAALGVTAGKPHAEMLAHLAALLRQARAQGVRVVLYLPPLIPGLDARLGASKHSGEHLRTTKTVLAQWARQQQVLLFDAGPSEQHGCTATEFIDAHHALPGCYRKVISKLFAANSYNP
jgi:hypothetical protein